MSPLLPGNWYVSSWEYVSMTAGFANDLNVAVRVGACLLSWTPCVRGPWHSLSVFDSGEVYQSTKLTLLDGRWLAITGDGRT